MSPITRRVKRWREQDNRHRWYIVGLLKAEERIQRTKGCKEIPTLVRRLDSLGVMESNDA